MIVIGPSQPQTVLPPFLNPGRAVATFPISPLFGKNNVAGEVRTEQADHAVQERMGPPESFGVLIENSGSRLQQFVRLEKGLHPGRVGSFREVTAVATPLDHFQERIVFARHRDAPKPGEWSPLGFLGNAMHSHEIGDAVALSYGQPRDAPKDSSGK